MSFQSALERILREYPAARSEPYTGHPLAQFLRDGAPSVLHAHLNSERYKVKGSSGQGGWVDAPWIAVFDRLVTETAQEGYYPVYLFREDFSGLYLSLNQGVTFTRSQYGADAKRVLQVRADDYLARLGRAPDGFSGGKIDLRPSSASANSAGYELGNVCAKFYPTHAIPSDAQLFADLETLLNAYRILVDRLQERGRNEEEDDEGFFEDPSKIRQHKRIERNRRLAERVKKLKGYRCEVCGFAYADSYADLRLDYIEAHHLMPFSQLGEAKVRLDPKTDFAVLCANCHRMIHRSECVHDVALFRLKHFRKKGGAGDHEIVPQGGATKGGSADDPAYAP